ncbi:hypothetical protein [Tritonibacter scottomollicae]|uniref:Uncharacterized protein n=1 Tax=Tritonibacter scottomollicae TaxID=483013 RepID=A0A2T1AJ20_TRISK|nr:hypothetical protein [Tritonibacter scottomollicae]PRZ48318.1 hypothetical protein CLV89_104146 [Tritonibacter scottomollicae]
MITQQYQTARSILTACVFVGWAFVVIGGVLALISLDEGSAFLVSGIASALSGLFLVVVCQVAFAIFDQAESSHMTLQVMKLIAEKQGVDLSSMAEVPAPSADVTLKPSSEEPSIASNVVMREDGAMVREYKGHEIVKIDKIYYVGETQFPTLGKAQRAISEGKV